MKTFSKVEVWIHAFLVLILDRYEWSAEYPRRSNSGNNVTGQAVSEVITAAMLRMQVVWDVTPCDWVRGFLGFERFYCPYL